MTTSLRLHAPPAVTRSLTLGETLAEIRRRRVRLRRTSTGVALLHRHMHPALADAVHRHNAALAVWLDMGRSAVVPGLEAWGEGVRLHARWLLERFAPPATPFALRPGEVVTDWARYTAALLERLALGPAAPGDAPAALAELFDRFAAATARPASARARRAA